MLSEIPSIAEQLNKKGRVNEQPLKDLHRVIWGPAKKADVRGHLLRFSGLVFDEDSEEERKKHDGKLNELSVVALKEVARILCLTISGHKEDMVVEILDFLEKPTSSEKNKRKKSSSSNHSKKKKKTGEEDSPQESDGDSDANGKEEEDEEEEEEQKKEKVVPKKTKQNKKQKKESKTSSQSDDSKESVD